MNLDDLDKASAGFRVCPRCRSFKQFWVGVRDDRPYVQCKVCGQKFELFEVYKIEGNKDSEARFLKK